MDQTQCQEDQCSAGKGKYFEELWHGFKRHLRDPKFFIELLALSGLIYYCRETKRTNDLTARALNANTTQFRMQERPYVSPTPRGGVIVHMEQVRPPKNLVDVPSFKLPVGKDGDYRMLIAMDIENVGHSPAVNMIPTKTKVFLGPADESRKQVLGYIPDYSQRSGDVLMVGVTKTVGGGDYDEQPLVTVAQDALITNGTWEAYIVGGIRYEDVFPLSQIAPYETVYCFKLNPKGMPFTTCDFRKTTIH